MTVNRIVYIGAVLAAAAALVATGHGIALFLLVCLLALPLLSLVLLLFARRRVRFRCDVRESCIRGGALQLTVRIGVTPRFFVGCAKVVAVIENTTFHKVEYKTLLCKDLSFAPHVCAYAGADSGRICVRFRPIALWDVFGIFCVKAPCPAFAEAIVSPVLYESIRLHVGAGGSDTVYGETSLPKKGGDITEIFNVREYRPGDAPGAIHWKLSTKFDALQSKEFGSTDDRKLLVLVDLSRKKFDSTATDAQLNAVLDVAVSVSNALQADGVAHSVGWFDDGVFGCVEVADDNSFVQAVQKLMSAKVNEGNEEGLLYLSRAATPYTKLLFVAASVHAAELKPVAGADVTAVSVGDTFGEVREGGARIVYVPCDAIDTALTACVL